MAQMNLRDTSHENNYHNGMHDNGRRERRSLYYKIPAKFYIDPVTGKTKIVPALSNEESFGKSEIDAPFGRSVFYDLDDDDNNGGSLKIDGMSPNRKNEIIVDDKLTEDEDGGQERMMKIAVDVHNRLRQIHGSHMLVASIELAKLAEMQARANAASHSLKHSPNLGYLGQGENLAFNCKEKNEIASIDDSIKDWYDEACKEDYDFNAEDGQNALHFTQVIWNSTKLLGCGRGISEHVVDGSLLTCTYFCCRYGPPGNMFGEFKKNVFKGSFDSNLTCNSVDNTIDSVARKDGKDIELLDNSSGSDEGENKFEREKEKISLKNDKLVKSFSNFSKEDDTTLPVVTNDSLEDDRYQHLIANLTSGIEEPEIQFSTSEDTASSNSASEGIYPKSQSDSYGIKNKEGTNDNSPNKSDNNLQVERQKFQKPFIIVTPEEESEKQLSQTSSNGNSSIPNNSDSSRLSFTNTSKGEQSLQSASAVIVNDTQVIQTNKTDTPADPIGGKVLEKESHAATNSSTGDSVRYNKDDLLLSDSMQKEEQHANDESREMVHNFAALDPNENPLSIKMYQNTINSSSPNEDKSSEPFISKSGTKESNKDLVSRNDSIDLDSQGSGMREDMLPFKSSDEPSRRQSTADQLLGGDSSVHEVSEQEQKFRLDSLNMHNNLRDIHGSRHLTIDDDMCESANLWAKYIASSNKLIHSKAYDYGENIAYSCSGNFAMASVNDSINDWYNEVCKHPYNFQADVQSDTLHFTQLIWDNSTALGMGMAASVNNGLFCTYFVAQYRPKGNIIGHFIKNVPKGNFDPLKICPKGDIPINEASGEVHTNETSKNSFQYIISTENQQNQSSGSSRDVKSDQVDTSGIEKNNLNKISNSTTNTKNEFIQQDGSNDNTGNNFKQQDEDEKNYQVDAIKVLNKIRQIHEVPDVNEDADLHQAARNRAASFVVAGPTEITKTPAHMGEIVQVACNPFDRVLSPEEAIVNWYSEVCSKSYDFDDYTPKNAFHLTQLIWKASKKVGIAYSTKKKKNGNLCTVVVGLFYPVGNVINEFRDNVLKGSFDKSFCGSISSIAAAALDSDNIRATG